MVAALCSTRLQDVQRVLQALRRVLAQDLFDGLWLRWIGAPSQTTSSELRSCARDCIPRRPMPSFQVVYGQVPGDLALSGHADSV